MLGLLEREREQEKISFHELLFCLDVVGESVCVIIIKKKN